MSWDRRRYAREPLNLLCSFYLKDENDSKHEFYGLLSNISEGGIGIFVSKESTDNYNEARKVIVGNVLSFQTFDEYKLFNEEHHDVITGEVHIVRINSNDEGIILGCEFKKMNQNMETYIRNKKVISFISKSAT